ncbi:Tyrosine recombinase XerD [bioreactor metagenome]|uniref:Tyrosine recombinase XerD n=1 Tax=bioreactor metagenome TaxID=1076179 RepID=A0A645CRT4_9ZZZZ
MRRNEYMSEVLKGHSSAVLFISKDGNQLTISGSDSIFQELKSKLGMNGKKYSAHTWRHTFAKTFLLNGGDVFTLQKILGHSDITTTKVYINLSDNEMKAQNSKFNPLDNSRWQYY